MTRLYDSRRYSTSYHYDPFYRLEVIKDDEDHILSQYLYNYRGE